jgi:ABC-2 type transport system permease protein
MSKLWMITGREYTSRVKKKTFILTTILAPIGFVIFWGALIFIMSSGEERKEVALLDPHDIMQLSERGKLKDGMITYKYPKTDLETLKENFKEEGYKGILYLPEQELDSLTKTINVQYYSDEDLGVNTKKRIKDAFKQQAKKIKMTAMNLDKETLDRLDTDVLLKTPSLDGTDDGAANYRVEIATALGGMMMFLIYFIIFIYGNMVMRSVMEEKTNRIVEVLISSVKPFELMLGKIIGVGAVGLTQIAIWAIVFPLLYLGMGFLFSDKLQEMQAATNVSTAETGDLNDTIMMVMNDLQSFNYVYIIGFFLVFFLLGYILYASLYAAVGAAMGDDWGEGQSLTLIVTLPIVIGFYIGISAVENPMSSMAVWSSMVPFFAPIVMPARIVFDPPLWQVLGSIVILIVSSLFLIWLSGRIYRVGILMYGKKTTFKEFVQWIFRKD